MPSTRTRPSSASSVHSRSTATNVADTSSYVFDRTGVLGLEASSKSDRPLPELLNLLLDAAHQRHESRTALHPATSAYALFSQRAAGAGAGSGVVAGPTPLGLEPSRSATSLAVAHSSLAVHAWGEAPPGASTALDAKRKSSLAAAAAAAAAADGAPKPAVASSAAAAPAPAAVHIVATSGSAAAATAPFRHPPASAVHAGRSSSRGPMRAPSPARLAASASLPVQQFAPWVNLRGAKPGTAKPTAATTAKITAAGAAATTKAAAASRTSPARTAGLAAKPAGSAKPAANGKPAAPKPATPAKPATVPKAASAGLGSSHAHGAASQSGPAVAAASGIATPVAAAAPKTKSAPVGHKVGAAATTSPARARAKDAGAKAREAAAAAPRVAAKAMPRVDEDSVVVGSEPMARRVRSAGSAGAGYAAGGGAGGGASNSAGGDAAAALLSGSSSSLEEQQRGPRQIVRPEVVARALSPWEGAELEVVCLYDANFQTANRQGQHGVPLRLPARPHIGPISYLYRWYCKRATQFRTPMSPADLPDGPAMPPPPTEEPWRSAAAAITDGAGGGSRSGSATRGGRPASAGSGGGDGRAGSAGGGGAAAAWLRKATTMRCHGGPGIGSGGDDVVDGGAAGRDGGLAAVEHATAAATSSGRRLNLSLDPVISLSEVVDMLEDLEIVPQLASRLDITKLFNAAAAAAAAAPAPASSATAATPAMPWQTGLGPHQQQPQQQPWCPAAMAAPAAGRPSTSVARRRPTSAAAGAAAAGASTRGGRADTWSVTFSAYCGAGGAPYPTSGPRVRPASAPRAPGRPAGGAGADGRGDGVGGGGHVIPRTQPHPQDVRFPVFKDILVRLAVAIACIEQPSRTAASVAAAAAAKRGSVGAVPAPSGGGGADNGWGRTMSADEAAAAVRRFVERLQLYRNGVRELKHRLDQLARLAREHAVRATANRMRYVAVPSPVEAAQDVAVAPGAAPPPPGARPGLPGRLLPPWGVLAAAPAPPYLTAVLAEEDQGDESRYRAAWREFGAVALDLGVLEPGELRRCRLLLHSRGPHALSVRIDASQAPCCDISHVGLQSIPYGMPLRVDVSVRLCDIGEVVGELRLRYSSSQDRREREIAVPVYGMVCGGGARMRPRSASERSVLAAKATREPVSRAVELAALAAAPLGHCGPPRRGLPPSAASPQLSASSSYLGGHGSISATEVPLAPQPSWRSAAATAPGAAAADADAAAAAHKTAASVRWAQTSAGPGAADADAALPGQAGNGGADGAEDGGDGGGGNSEHGVPDNNPNASASNSGGPPASRDAGVAAGGGAGASNAGSGAGDSGDGGVAPAPAQEGSVGSAAVESKRVITPVGASSSAAASGPVGAVALISAPEGGGWEHQGSEAAGAHEAAGNAAAAAPVAKAEAEGDAVEAEAEGDAVEAGPVAGRGAAAAQGADGDEELPLGDVLCAPDEEESHERLAGAGEAEKGKNSFFITAADAK